jgi:ribosomal protein S18 acetylase RimI-like enzyme
LVRTPVWRGYCPVSSDVRETQQAAIRLYKSLGYEHWATHPHYAWVRGDTIRGYFFFKDLTTTDQPPDR